MNSNVNIISDEKRVRPKNSEVNRLFGDNKLLKELTGWVPEFDGLEGFKKGLNLTIEWFENKKNLSFYRTDEYMI